MALKYPIKNLIDAENIPQFMTKIFTLESNDNDSDSDKKGNSDVDHGKSKAETRKTNVIKHVVNSSKNISTSTKIVNPTTKKADESSNLRKSLVRFRGANPTITPSNYEKNVI